MTTEDERREEKKVDEPAVEIWLTARKWRIGVWFWWLVRWKCGAANGRCERKEQTTTERGVVAVMVVEVENSKSSRGE